MDAAKPENPISPPKTLHFIACPRPFSTQQITREMPEGGTIADMFRAIGLPPESLSARVFIDDRLILKAEWEYATPRAGQFVTARVIPTGGGGGGKDALRIVAIIGVVIAAAWTAGGGLAGLGFLPEGLQMAFASHMTAASVAGAVVGIGGTLAVNGRIPPPLPRRSLLEPGRKEAA